MHAIISIDIGVKNLGYTIFSYNDAPLNLSDFNIEFDIYNITSKKKDLDDGAQLIISSRCQVLYNFFKMLQSKYVIDYIIIEKQVQTNTIAMELMYSIYSFALTICNSSNIFIFDPKLKFTSINVSYETKNKQHKRQSIKYARNLLSKKYPDKVVAFDKYDKKDDISDSLNQGIIFLIMKGVIEETFIDLRNLYEV